MTISEKERRQFIILVRRKESSELDYPAKWHPESVNNPATGMPFTGPSAWELIAVRLENGEPMKTVELRNPPGKKAYVMQFRLEPRGPKLYVKLRLVSGKVLGRSFHYSDPR